MGNSKASGKKDVNNFDINCEQKRGDISNNIEAIGNLHREDQWSPERCLG